MKKINDFRSIIENKKYNSNPELIKLLLEYIGNEGHQKIQTSLFKKLINNYVNLSAELEDKVQEITRLSETDHLTGIYNRVKFMKKIEEEYERFKRYNNDVSLIMFDIDHFKSFNDTFGHDIGDLVLVEVTKSVSKNIRQTDIFARWGGEEFMILAPETSMDVGYELAEKVREKISQIKFDVKDVGNVTCSFGVTQIDSNDNLETVLKKVDEALYESKENGRNKTTKFIENL